MTSPILLTGGTGTLGRLVGPLLRERGHKVRVLSRSHHEPTDGIEYATGDLSTGEGADAAVTGAEIVVHLAGTMKGDEDKAAHLVRAASGAGVRHLVYISVVGAERLPVVSRTDRAMFGYFASKRAAERIVMDSGVPWTILRATQFHDLILPIEPQEQRWFDAIDGHRRIRSILGTDAAAASARARAFFEKLWQYDQVVFDTSQS